MIGALPLSEIIEDDAPRACRVPSCPRPHTAHGYCDLHLKRLLRQGDTSAPTREGALGRLVARALDLADVDADDDAAWEAALGELERASDFFQAVKGRGGARARKAAKDASWRDRWAGVKRAVLERAAGRCEVYQDGQRCTEPAVDADHLFGGALRRETTTPEGCQATCRTHHNLKTVNAPSRAFWLDQADEHVLRHGYRSMLRYVARARALLEGKRRPS